MKPFQLFQHCPRCGQRAQPPAEPLFRCAACGLQYYFNPAIAAAAFILRPDGCALFIRRAKDPARGKLAIPGGFVDAGETAEEAVRREIKEEVNLELKTLTYLCSHTNVYAYKGVEYSVLDLFYVSRVEGSGPVAALDGVETFAWLNPSTVDPEEIAFPSMRKAMAELRAGRG